MIQVETPTSGGSTPPARTEGMSPDSASAGPSSPPRSPRCSIRSQLPESLPTDASDSATIQKHLDKHRRSSLLGKKKSSSRLKKEASEAAAWHEQMNDVDEEAEQEVVERSVTFDMEELRRTMPEAVKMLRDGEEWEGVDLDDGLERGFAWDVMFENQRGIHFLGKAYFTSNSLLPSDPSQYTLPGKPIPTASSMTISTSGPSEGPDHALRPAQPAVKTSRLPRRLHPSKPGTYDPNYGEHHINLSAEHRNIKTAYSLTTYQCPGPQWEWVTPWMINMKVGTDEDGWRYNAWFKQKGWRNHAGPAGWWGWVRRREWVRLRTVRPMGHGEEREVDETRQGEGKADGKGSSKREARLDMEKVLMQAKKDDGPGAVLHAMSSISLDREKLAWWEAGLSKADGREEVRHRIQEMLDDEDIVSCQSANL